MADIFNLLDVEVDRSDEPQGLLDDRPGPDAAIEN